MVNLQPSGPNVFEILGMVGGLLGLAAIVSLPWTVKKLSAEAKSIEVTTETGASDIALKHLKTALEEADKTINRIKNEYQQDILTLEQQVSRLSRTLEEERAKSERERELYEKRVVQLLYDIHAKDLEITRLKQGRIDGSTTTS